MEIICINDKFSPEWEAYFLLNGITKPVTDKMYTIREVVPNTVGETGILLAEIVNKSVPKVSPLTGFKGMAEQNWAISRFANLHGQPLSKETIQEVSKNLVTK